MLVIQEFHQGPEKLTYDYKTTNGYGTNAINSRRDSMAVTNN
jgi:hypothetical protein